MATPNREEELTFWVNRANEFETANERLADALRTARSALRQCGHFGLQCDAQVAAILKSRITNSA